MEREKFLKSVYCALIGIAHGISRERNIKIQIMIGFGIIVLAYFLAISKIEFIIIIIMAFLVPSFELVNTAIEKLIDRIHPDFDTKIGRVKDIMAGAVLLIVFLSIIVGLLILFVPFMTAIHLL
jgi:diacylglycerol kinase